MTIGIYKLTFPSNLPYIGQSINIEKRYREHCRNLKQGLHSRKVQAEYNKYQVLPTMEILVECSKEELDVNENEAIEIWDSVNHGLNTLEKAGEYPNVSCGETHPNAKYSNQQYKEILLLLVEGDLLYDEIATKVNVHVQLIKDIKCGRTNVWLKDVYPLEYDKMIKSYRNSGLPSIVSKRPPLQNPNGKVYDLSGLSVTAFAKEHNLNVGALTDVLNGKRSQHKGWKILIG